ncbi:MAG: hypothetical protein PHI02_04330 [Sulfurovaceae bacterium]|nr:hypothetical protein [Sulfurovaceae bacterium]
MTILLHDGYFLGTWLARFLGLNDTYFSKAYRHNIPTLLQDVKIEKFSGIIFVKPPQDVHRLIEQNYIAVKIMPGDDINQYDYILNLTKDTKIGFWK